MAPRPRGRLRTEDTLVRAARRLSRLAHRVLGRSGGQAVPGREIVDRILHAQRWANERLGEVIHA